MQWVFTIYGGGVMSKLTRIFLTFTLAMNMGLIGMGVSTRAQTPAPIKRTPTHEPKAPLKDITSVEDLDRFVTYYYIYPQPDLAAKAILFTEKQGYLNRKSVAVPLLAFFSRIFAQNSDKIPSLVEQLKVLQPMNKSFLYTILYLADTDQTRKMMPSILKELPADYQASVAKAKPHPVSFELREIKSPTDIDILWMCFMATGDDRYVKKIIAILPLIESKDPSKIVLGGAARWSLSSNAVQHKHVLEICLKARESSPDCKKTLGEIIDRAQKNVAK
jgi:hypothetical protein